MAEKSLKRLRNKPNSPEKAKDLCVTCKKKVSTEDDAIECQWCEQWEHKVCTKVIDNAYKLLDDTSSNIMFFCSLCCPEVPSALSNYGSTNVNFDNRLREMETKLSNIVDDINTKLDNHYKKLEAKLTTWILMAHLIRIPSYLSQ